MIPTTTKGAARQGDAPQTARPGKASQQFHPSSKEQNMSSVPHNFTEGQKVRIIASVYAGSLGTVTGVDEDGPWRVRVKVDDTSFPAVYFAPEKLEPVHTDDTVPASDEEVVEYITGSDPRDAPRGTVGEAPIIPIWEAARGVPSTLNALAMLCDLPARDVAHALRAVAAVLDGGDQ